MEKYFVHPTSIIDEGAQIGHGSKIWHFSHVMQSAKIGKNCILGQNVFIGNRVAIGNNVKIQNNVSVYEGVQCNDNVFIGPSVVFTNVLNPRSSVNRKSEFKNTFVKEGTSIGANATIICGTTIGKFAFIGAGAVVSKDVEDYALVLGNPARHTGWMSEYGFRLQFNEEGVATCDLSGEKYQLNDGKVVKSPLLTSPKWEE